MTSIPNSPIKFYETKLPKICILESETLISTKLKIFRFIPMMLSEGVPPSTLTYNDLSKSI